MSQISLTLGQWMSPGVGLLHVSRGLASPWKQADMGWPKCASARFTKQTRRVGRHCGRLARDSS
jgi:hypothetical protein